MFNLIYQNKLTELNSKCLYIYNLNYILYGYLDFLIYFISEFLCRLHAGTKRIELLVKPVKVKPS